jgi:two-component system sensor histidine kinase/response regulator
MVAGLASNEKLALAALLNTMGLVWDLSLSLLEEDAENLHLGFEVQDSGVGIDPEFLSKVFDSFYQVDGSSSRKHGGTGLGLAIVRQLVELMGGEVSATSAAGQGSIFKFFLRLRKLSSLPA